MTDQDQNNQLAALKDRYEEKYGFSVPETQYSFKSQKGINRDIVAQISEMKNEPQWMRDFPACPGYFREKAHAYLGRRPERHQFR